jgi:hypothetical protein
MGHRLGHIQAWLSHAHNQDEVMEVMDTHNQNHDHDEVMTTLTMSTMCTETLNDLK